MGQSPRMETPALGYFVEVSFSFCTRSLASSPSPSVCQPGCHAGHSVDGTFSSLAALRPMGSQPWIWTFHPVCVSSPFGTLRPRTPGHPCQCAWPGLERPTARDGGVRFLRLWCQLYPRYAANTKTQPKRHIKVFARQRKNVSTYSGE